MRIFIGSDHAGLELKQALVTYLKDIQFVDCGCHSKESCDYPVFAKAVAEHVIAERGLGILICGSGIGMSIAANKIKGIRAAVVTDVTAARLCREHNDANIVCVGGRLIGVEVAIDICKTFLKTQFLGQRHGKRIAQISNIEGAS